MTDSMITLQGYVGTEPTLRDAGATRVAGFRLASTPRRFVKATNQWVDGETVWYSVSAWRQLGDHVAQSLHKGDPVFVHGRLTCHTWVNREGLQSSDLQIEALVAGHDLNRVSTGTVRVPAVAPARGSTTFPEPEPRPGEPGGPGGPGGPGEPGEPGQDDPDRIDWGVGPSAGLPPDSDPWAEEIAAKAAERDAQKAAAAA